MMDCVGKMEQKNNLLKWGVTAYIWGALAAGIITGKVAYDALPKQTVQQSSGIERKQFSWKDLGLASLVGLGVFAAFAAPTERWSLPRCPECKTGRLRDKEELVRTYTGPAQQKFYYVMGIGAIQHFTDVEITTYCDRCEHKTSREKTVPGNIEI